MDPQKVHKQASAALKTEIVQETVCVSARVHFFPPGEDFQGFSKLFMTFPKIKNHSLRKIRRTFAVHSLPPFTMR